MASELKERRERESEREACQENPVIRASKC